MFSLMIAIEGRENAFVLFFRERKSAEAWLKDPDRDRMEDDFGHSLQVDRHDIAASMISDIDRDHECQTEMAIRQARAQAKANAKAQNDPALKFMMAQRAPGLVG